ncbi:MAG TPA: hypothetical protein VHE33_11750, partial [Acidobacteriaceae bacterium]|nr:hypothetical protein [Acidobacteriaceae bacterium]
FLIAGVLTGAAVLRAGFRIFVGLGDSGPVDESAKVDEGPETREEQNIYWFLFVPALVCLGSAVALAFWPAFANGVHSCAIRFMDFRSYAHAVYQRATPQSLLAAPQLHGGLAVLLAVLRPLLAAGIALWAVYRIRVPRALRWPSHLEGPLRPLRELQSGHPGDYVAWLTVGFAALGGVAFWLGLR